MSPGTDQRQPAVAKHGWHLLRVVACIACVACFAVAGCGREQRADGSSQLVFARGSDAQKLDPADVDDGESVNVLAQTCEGLVRFAPGSLKIEPWLAEAFHISADGLEYTFELRQGVTFHDGVKLTAETAAFSFLRQMDPAHPAHFSQAGFQYWRALFDDIEAIDITGPMTLRFRLRQPNAALLASLATFPAWLISPGALDAHGEGLQQFPVGTGPYRFVSWQPGETIILERNDSYWGAAAGFERIVFKVTPENSVRLLELMNGVIDGADGLQPADALALAEDPRFNLYRGGSMNFGYLAFNSDAPGVADRRVREAIALAIDREAIARIGLDGAGIPADYPLPPGFLGRPDEPGDLNHDPQQARRLLQGISFDRPLKLSTFTAPRIYFPDPVRVASLIRDDLQRVGIPVEVVSRDFQSHLTAVRSGEHEMALLGWIGDNGDPDNFLAVLLGSAGAVPGSATNIAFYRNPQFDQRVAAARLAVDPAQREALYFEALRLWRRDLPLIPIVHGEQLVVWRADVAGFVAHPTGEIRLGTVSRDGEAP